MFNFPSQYIKCELLIQTFSKMIQEQYWRGGKKDQQSFNLLMNTQMSACKPYFCGHKIFNIYRNTLLIVTCSTNSDATHYKYNPVECKSRQIFHVFYYIFDAYDTLCISFRSLCHTFVLCDSQVSLRMVKLLFKVG